MLSNRTLYIEFLDNIMGIVFSILCFMILISILVAVHEYGHLIIARANGVFVESFSIGYGPALMERTDRLGTKWKFSLIPLGGYVKMMGDADVTSVREVIPEGMTEQEMEQMSVHRKKPWQKLVVAAGGPLFNFIFAIMVLIGLAMMKGIPVYTNAVNTVSDTSLAYVSGIRSGDKIILANEMKIMNFEDIRKSIKESEGKFLNLKIEHRGGQQEDIQIKMCENNGSPISAIGITPAELNYKKAGIGKAFTNACHTTYFVASENIKAIFQILTAKRSTKDVGGVISIFNIAAESAKAGVAEFVWIMAFLSIILGAINLLPIPVLDGGTILISSIEWIMGRPLNEKLVNCIFFMGLFIVSVLMLLGIWNDLEKCKFFENIMNLFR